MSGPSSQPPTGVHGDHVEIHDNVIVGDVVGKQVIHQHPPRPPASWPHQVGVIPPKAGFFQDRAEAARLREVLSGSAAAVLVGQDSVRGQVLTGMGGVGKTQLAADYARAARQAGEVDLLIWITANTSSAVVSGYAQAAVEALGADPTDPQAAARALLAWLEPAPRTEPPCRWLIVLDDVSDPADLHGLWPPSSPHGRTLVTTRRQDAALTRQGRQLVTIGLFTEAESLDYLREALAAHDRHDPAEQLAALAGQLGHLPLALSQAAAYLADTGISVSAYQSLLADRGLTLADASPDALPDDQPHTMAAAWALSIDRADTLRPHGLARPLLRLAAFLDPNGIPEDVLTSGPVLTYLTDSLRADTAQAAPPVTAEQAKLALSALRRLSLAHRTSAGTGFPTARIHQLIQHSVRDALTPDEHCALARTAADALCAVWPDLERDPTLAQSLRSNTTALTTCAESALYLPDVHTVLLRAGRSLGESGQVNAAVEYFRHLADTAHGHVGRDGPKTLNARHNLAHWLGEAGDAAGAAHAFAALLQDMVRVLGPDHVETLIARNNGAYWQGQAGDAAGAANAFAALLRDRLRVLGVTHPHTMETCINLAHWLGEAGDAAGAAEALAELLQVMSPALGQDDTRILAMCRLLAHWRGTAGDAAGAAAAYPELVERLARVLGPDHPDTLTVRSQRAYWREKAGDAAGAAAEFAELLDDMVRVLGPDHPNSLETRNLLAHVRGQAGNAAEAAAAYPELLDDMYRVLGRDAPSTLAARSNFADWTGQSGDARGAADAFAELLRDMTRVMGAHHPSTLVARGNLAYYRRQAGDVDEAVTEYGALLKDMLHVLGAAHPHTVSTLVSLLDCRLEKAATSGEAATPSDLLQEMTQLLGPEHLRAMATSRYFRDWARDMSGGT
ncbi:tetratricopeptide repeat protein [Streptomyces sp. 5-8]|uniref:Tetratricopeptide repeat protein n=1 Tax=Streptomyces musisoli TaxID=2802280 RepID=A0ABS1NWK5_9ACTN|nr:tetratricopeptide repeat protein [Streptomyces musisoli]MBL1104507.1 tetratricopeptide repeat protein [Streptomyces musisoli]